MPARRTSGAILLDQVAQDGRKDAAVFVVEHVDGSIESRGRGEGGDLAARAGRLDHDVLARAQALLDAGDLEGLVALERVRFGVLAVLENQRQDTHTDQ